MINDSPIFDAVQPFIENQTLAGAVLLVADRENVLALETLGSADIAAGKPMQHDTLFWIASQTKPITATALMMLVETGKIALDDAVVKYLPEFADQWMIATQTENEIQLRRPSRPITVRDILSHVSGLPFIAYVEQPYIDRLPLSTAVRSYVMNPLLFEPGTRYQYSNQGINVAGRLIELVSEMPFTDFLQARLFDPLGMSDTTFYPNPQQVARLAKTYQPNTTKDDLEETTLDFLSYPLDDPTRQPVPGGGLFSTSKDVARFCQMILNNGTFEGTTYITEASLREMTRKQTGDLAENYGLGWAIEGTSYGHGGACSTSMMVHPAQGIITSYLVQHRGFPGNGGESKKAFTQTALETYGNNP